MTGMQSESEPEQRQAGPPDEPVDLEPVRSLTRQRAHDLRALLSKYVSRHLPESTPAPSSPDEPPRFTGSHARLLPLLKVVPWALLVAFVVSFLWDFDGVAVGLAGTVLDLDGLLRILAVSGLIGFLTNWLAITMLFNPRSRRPLFGQGLIPAQRERVIYRLAKAVSDELINEEIIKQRIEASGVIPKYREMAMAVARGVLEDEEFRTDLKRMTVDYVNHVLASDRVRERIVAIAIEKLEEQMGVGLSGIALKVYRFLNEDELRRKLDQAVRELPNSLDNVMDEMDRLLDTVPGRIEARSDQIETWTSQVVLGFVEKLDVYTMVMENMRNYDDTRLEELIKRASNEQLNYIKYLGGLLGCVGGLVIWKPLLALAVLGGIGIVLFAVDESVYRLRRVNSPREEPPS